MSSDPAVISRLASPEVFYCSHSPEAPACFPPSHSAGVCTWDGNLETTGESDWQIDLETGRAVVGWLKQMIVIISCCSQLSRCGTIVWGWRDINITRYHCQDHTPLTFHWKRDSSPGWSHDQDPIREAQDYFSPISGSFSKCDSINIILSNWQ